MLRNVACGLLHGTCGAGSRGETRTVEYSEYGKRRTLAARVCVCVCGRSVASKRMIESVRSVT